MTQETPPSGYLEGDAHVLPIRVYYEDTDAAGLVYHANYLRFAERARSELLRLIGIDQGALRREQGLAFALRDCSLDYLQPAWLDDALLIRSRLTELRGASLRMQQDVMRSGEILVRIDVRVVCLRLSDGRAVRLPRTACGKFQAFGAASQNHLKNAMGS